MILGVLPTQNVAAPRRSSPKAPKPNVVYAWRGGPLSPALGCKLTLFLVERATCSAPRLDLNIALVLRGVQASLLTTKRLQGDEGTTVHTHSLHKQVDLSAEADAGRMSPNSQGTQNHTIR